MAEEVHAFEGWCSVMKKRVEGYKICVNEMAAGIDTALTVIFCVNVRPRQSHQMKMH